MRGEHRRGDRLEVRAGQAEESPRNVSAGERRKGQEGLGAGTPRRDWKGRQVRVLQGRGGILGRGESWKGQERLGVRVPEGTVPGDEHPETRQERLKGRILGEKKDPELEK